MEMPEPPLGPAGGAGVSTPAEGPLGPGMEVLRTGGALLARFPPLLPKLRTYPTRKLMIPLEIHPLVYFSSLPFQNQWMRIKAQGCNQKFFAGGWRENIMAVTSVESEELFAFEKSNELLIFLIFFYIFLLWDLGTFHVAAIVVDYFFPIYIMEEKN